MYSDNDSFTTPPSSQPRLRTAKKWYQRWWGRTIIVFSVIFLTLLVAFIFYVGKMALLLKSGEITPQELFGGEPTSQQVGDLNTLATFDDPSLGPRDAKIVIVEFSDFQCPFCNEAKPVIKEVLKNYGDQILFIYRDFPLVDIHPQALLAAMAGECAHEQGKFWEMHDRIFENQDEITQANLKIHAVAIGLNNIQFDNCLASGKYLKEIEEDLRDGLAAGVGATPTFFINGVKVAGVIPLTTFEQIIFSELNR